MTIYEIMDLIFTAADKQYDRCVAIMVGCATLVCDYLPPVGREAYAIAQNYWVDHTGDAGQLETARVRCWTYLREQRATYNTEEKHYCAVRAIICLLYAEPEPDETNEGIEFFIEMVHCVEKDVAVIEREVRQHIATMQ